MEPTEPDQPGEIIGGEPAPADPTPEDPFA